MANQFVNIPIPASSGQTGAAVDVSGLGADKTVIVQGTDPVGVAVIEGSNDGVNFAPVVNVSLNLSPIAISGPFKKFRARRVNGSGVLSAVVGADGETCTFAVLPNNGSLVDVSTMGTRKSVVLTGTWSGSVQIKGSNDDVHFDPIVFANGGSASVLYITSVFKSMKIDLSAAVGVTGLTVNVAAAPGAGGGGGGASSNQVKLSAVVKKVRFSHGTIPAFTLVASNGDAGGNLIAVAQASNAAFSYPLSPPIGIVQQALSGAVVGDLVIEGQTTALLATGLTVATGDELWLDSSGNVTNIQPSSPVGDYSVFVGVVIDPSLYGTNQTAVIDLQLGVSTLIGGAVADVVRLNGVAKAGGKGTVPAFSIVSTIGATGGFISVQGATTFSGDGAPIGVIQSAANSLLPPADIIIAGRTQVLLHAGLTPLDGQSIWLTSGLPSTVLPTLLGERATMIGSIVPGGAASYGVDQTVTIMLTRNDASLISIVSSGLDNSEILAPGGTISLSVPITYLNGPGTYILPDGGPAYQGFDGFDKYLYNSGSAACNIDPEGLDGSLYDGTGALITRVTFGAVPDQMHLKWNPTVAKWKIISLTLTSLGGGATIV